MCYIRLHIAALWCNRQVMDCMLLWYDDGTSQSSSDRLKIATRNKMMMHYTKGRIARARWGTSAAITILLGQSVIDRSNRPTDWPIHYWKPLPSLNVSLFLLCIKNNNNNNMSDYCRSLVAVVGKGDEMKRTTSKRENLMIIWCWLRWIQRYRYRIRVQ